eukprot:1178749-Rhodomonas_salina.3
MAPTKSSRECSAEDASTGSSASTSSGRWLKDARLRGMLRISPELRLGLLSLISGWSETRLLYAARTCRLESALLLGPLS